MFSHVNDHNNDQNAGTTNSSSNIYFVNMIDVTMLIVVIMLAHFNSFEFLPKQKTETKGYIKYLKNRKSKNQQTNANKKRRANYKEEQK